MKKMGELVLTYDSSKVHIQNIFKSPIKNVWDIEDLTRQLIRNTN